MSYCKLLIDGARFAAFVAFAMACATAQPLRAGDWTYPVLVQEPPRMSGLEPFNGKEIQYKPVAKASKKWNICALWPHVQGDLFRAYTYGAIDEATQDGVKLTIFEAGGYANLDKQISQFDDCVTLGADAILAFAISPDGLNQKIKEARSKGIKVIDVNNGVTTEVDGRVVVAYYNVGKFVGEKLAAAHPKGSGRAEVVLTPGPAGVPWVEDTVRGFQDATKDSDVVVVKVMYGGISRPEQQPLIEDALVTYPDLKYIVGAGSAIEGGMNVLREKGMAGKIGMYSIWITPTLMEGVEKGEVAGIVVESSTMIKRLAIDVAVRALEGTLEYKDVIPAVQMLDKSDIKENPLAHFAPADWQMTMTVD